jgi:beta-mannosidase
VVRDLALLIDRVDPFGIVDDGLITLLPGETVELTVLGAEGATASDFGGALVLRTANDLVAPR